ncbi:MBL fold metallo-hydrolase [Coraliomargarita akajimensis]|uniref:Metallo-beta-lactamase family protein n=1 Tax=Coraliomargarita akajimensis (strain DSM 45221 / IAM 15411 / JCM 23193 / KCTC 12865 / 04OKA010-24) TaxID=583355 RepID=D5EHZ2_CORAD|nr:MBL fold metallo-hydrolase [Coraliomargarita akajimensis]ADE56032.1 metallo-beta-lactamase family protein [Coraliomargarita akajimensis DSM 45221]
MSIHATIWGSCGSLPSPATSADIRAKVRQAVWEAKDSSFRSIEEVDRFLDDLPHSMSGTYRSNTSCVEIHTDSDEIVFCDAGTGIRDYAHQLSDLSTPRCYHIFISHLHWDHIQGFPFFTPAYIAGNRIIIHGFHPETEEAIRMQMNAPCFPVPFEAMQASIEFDIQPEGACFDVAGIHVRSIKQVHPGDSWGYRFEKDGKSIVYSSDSEHGPESTAPDYPFIEFFRNADALIFDGQYTLEQVKNEKRNWGHSDHTTAIELAARAEVKRLIIFHHEPAYADAEIETIHSTAIQQISQNHYQFPKRIDLAYDGLYID